MITTLYKNLLLALFTFLPLFLFAQTTITGKVVDKNDGVPLPYVYLKIDKIALGYQINGGNWQLYHQSLVIIPIVN